jgi:hypothetical protein
VAVICRIFVRIHVGYIRSKSRIFDIRRISVILYLDPTSDQTIRIRIRYPKKIQKFYPYQYSPSSNPDPDGYFPNHITSLIGAIGEAVVTCGHEVSHGARIIEPVEIPTRVGLVFFLGTRGPVGRDSRQSVPGRPHMVPRKVRICLYKSAHRSRIAWWIEAESKRHRVGNGWYLSIDGRRRSRVGDGLHRYLRYEANAQQALRERAGVICPLGVGVLRGNDARRRLRREVNARRVPRWGADVVDSLDSR